MEQVFATSLIPSMPLRAFNSFCKIRTWIILLNFLTFELVAGDNNRLSNFGFSDDRNGVVNLLSAINEKGGSDLLLELIRDLDADDFSNREAATIKLSLLPVIDRSILEKKIKDASPEAKVRIQRILKKNSKERFDNMVRALLSVIIEDQLKGFIGDLFEALESKDAYEMGAVWRAFGEASAVTAGQGDAERLNAGLKSENDMIRYAAVKAIGALLGQDAAPIFILNVNDSNPHIKWEVARYLSQFEMRECLKPLAELLMCNEDFGLRWRSLDELRNLTGKDFGYYAAGNQEEREGPAALWKRWVMNEGAVAKLNFGNSEKFSTIVLFNGANLQGWSQRETPSFPLRAQIPEQKQNAWFVDKGVLASKEIKRRDLVTEESFLNYSLTFEYRIPTDRADSGVGVFVGDAGEGYLEVQLINGKSGDLYRIGNFNIQTDSGEKLGFSSPKFKESNEFQKEWNKMEVIVIDGTLEVKVNGLLQNRAKSGPKKPSRIILRNEGSRVEFKNLLLKKI